MRESAAVKPIIILGCGYVGSRVARAALAEGRTVRVCARSTGKLAPLGELGAQVKHADAAVPKSFVAAMAGLQGATVLYSVPAGGMLPPGHAMRAALQAAYGGGCDCFIYLSSSGLYGEDPDDDNWIDEATPIVEEAAMKAVLSDEAAALACSFDRLRPVILRLAPVYGPGRGVRERLKKGTYKLLDDGQHAISRIHVDDVVRVIFAAEERAPDKALYLVADDEPTTQRDYAKWLSERMGLPMPPARSRFEPGAAKVAHRNRRIRNTKMKAELALTLKYPTFREGEAAIEAELGQG
jgi:nucleoside-diphosphate-sugar epimerase